MSALQFTIQPCDSGKTIETALVNGSVAEGVLRVTSGQAKAFNDFLAKVRAGQDTSFVEDALALNDADVLEVVEAAIGLINMSSNQKTGLLGYIAAIIAEEDTSGVETAIGLI